MYSNKNGAVRFTDRAILKGLLPFTLRGAKASGARTIPAYARPRVRIMKVSKAYSLSWNQGSTSLR